MHNLSGHSELAAEDQGGDVCRGGEAGRCGGPPALLQLLSPAGHSALLQPGLVPPGSVRGHSLSPAHGTTQGEGRQGDAGGEHGGKGYEGGSGCGGGDCEGGGGDCFHNSGGGGDSGGYNCADGGGGGDCDGVEAGSGGGSSGCGGG